MQKNGDILSLGGLATTWDSVQEWFLFPLVHAVVPDLIIFFPRPM